MGSLVDRIREWGHWIVFLFLEVVSLVLLFRFNAYQGSVWFTQANAVSGKVLEWESRMKAYAQLGSVNKQLAEENLRMQAELSVLHRRLAELEHDSSLTERVLAEQLAGIRHIPAQVISNSIKDRDNLITINRGSADGVRKEMGVVCGTGVVGIVANTGRHYAIVLPVLNSHSSISCRLKDSEYFGYMKWNGGNPLRAFIDDIPRHARIRKDESVETSGFSSVFPPGIFVGRVRRVLNSDDGLSYKLEIGLSTDFAKLRDVSVIEWEGYEREPELEAEDKNAKK
ncbi:MAG: rod shape-determining protein MreC [Bacteroidaceae bacterium]|nr:rod shape-determining protein MreC [Bacteroidaceae bacterium]MBR1789159.1 rod shape-determining protein MreC [Bacteroidaceae bacterium]